MIEASQRGVEILRILALAIRAEQDYGLTSSAPARVGARKKVAGIREAEEFIRAYVPPYDAFSGFSGLNLRQALNKIAHAHPTNAGYHASAHVHDLVLYDVDHGEHWISVVSLIDLCSAIRSLPDRVLPRGA